MYAELARTAIKPVFTNEPRAWVPFKEVFFRYIQIITARQHAPDELLLEYLIACLPEELRVEFALMQKMSAPAQVTYQQFFNHLDTRFGSMPTSTARAVWTDVRLDVEGKITPAKFATFKVAFLSAMLDVKDTTSDEATRMLLSKLQRYPGNMTWINRAESKEGELHPAFEI